MVLLMITPIHGRRPIGVLLHRLIDRQRGEIGLHHAEVVPGLVPLGVGGPLEEPEIGHAHPGPLGLNTLVGLHGVAGLLLLAHPAVGGGHPLGHGAPVHLRDPDGLGLVAVLDHDVADVEDAGEVDHLGPHPPVPRPRPEAIALHREDVEVIPRPGVVHPLQEDEIVQIPRPQLDGGGQGAGDDRAVGIGLLGPGVSNFQELGVGLRVHRLLAPLGVDVGLVPDLVVFDAPPVAAYHRVDEVAEVVEIVRRGQGASGVPVVARPSRGIGEAGDDFEPVFLGQLDDVIVLLPGRAMRLVAAVLEIALAVDLDVLPGELLANPAEAGLADHPERPLALLWLHLLL